jgi:hypothetical protein
MQRRRSLESWLLECLEVILQFELTDTVGIDQRLVGAAAGGYDAICVVVLHKRVLQAVEDLWAQWPSTHPNCMYVCRPRSYT